MSAAEVTAWEQTTAGLLCHGGPVGSAVAAEDARVLEEKRQQHAEYEARMDAADARLQAEGRLGTPWREVRKAQEALVAQGWPGRWMPVGRGPRPPELEPLYAAAAAAEGTGMRSTDANGNVTYSGSPEMVARMQEADQRAAERELSMRAGPRVGRLP